jgi:CDP-glucose 4,6-dehydratase
VTPADHPWAGRRILVTGAAGLLGGWMAQALLDAGGAVFGLDIAWQRAGVATAPDGMAAIDGDVRDASLLSSVLGDTAVDTVIHLAAQALVGTAVDDPVDTFRHNIEGTWTLLEACREAPRVRRIVVASSDKAYGDGGGRPYREDGALRALHPYDASKAAADILARTYAHSYDLPVAVSRCGNLFGGGDLHWSRIVPGTIRSVLQGERPIIRSDGRSIRDYLYARDAAEGLLRLADAVGERPDMCGTAFNFAGGHRLSVLELASRIVDLMGSSLVPDVQGTARLEIPEQRVSSARARRELQWRPTVPFTDAMRETIGWYRDHPDTLV